MVSARIVMVDLRLDAETIDRCVELLDTDERQRADRFLRAADLARFIASHAALRLVIGRELGVAASGLRFCREPAGRPSLQWPAETGLDFNLSHSGHLALIGLTRGARIGVDIEMARPLPDALRIARSHFAREEIAALEALPPASRESAFFGLWTRKEAIVKALGVGLFQPLSDFAVSVPPAAPRMLKPNAGWPSWTFAILEAGPGAFAAAAVTAESASIEHEALLKGWIDTFATK